MKSIKGIYDGKKIEPLEPIDAPSNVEVIITFLEEPLPDAERERLFWKSFGSWQDTRSVDEIVQDIYQSRTSSDIDVDL